MPRFSPTAYAEASAAAQRDMERRNQAASTATPQQAANIASDHADYPWLNPQVIALLNSSNVSPQVRQTAATAAGTQAVQAGAFPEPPAPKPTKKPQGWWGHVYGAVKNVTQDVTSILAAPLQAEMGMIGQNIGAGMEGLRAIPRGDFGTVAKSAGKIALNAAATMPGGVGAKEAFTEVTGGKQDLNSGLPGAIRGTDLFQSIRHPEDEGTGFFAGEKITARSGEVAKQTRGVDPGGHAWTIGRLVTTGIPQNAKKDEGAHKFLSGLVDAAAALTLDPVNVASAATTDVGKIGKIGTAMHGPIGAATIRARQAEGVFRTAEVGKLAVQSGKAVEAIKQADAALEATKQPGYLRNLLGEYADLAHKATLPSAAAGAHDARLAELSDLIHGAQSGETALTAAQRSAEWSAHLDDLANKAETMAGATKTMEHAAAKNPEWFQQVSASAGLVSSPTGNTVVQRNTFKWLLSTEGQHTVDRLVNETSAAKIMLAYGGPTKISVGSVQALADAKDTEGVIAALGKALDVTSGKLRDPSMVKSEVGLNLSQSIGDRFPSLARAMGSVPDARQYMDFAKPEMAVQEVFDTLGHVGITGKERLGITDEWIKAFAEGDKSAYFKLGEKTNDMLAGKLIESGMSPEDANRITTSFRKTAGDIKYYASTDLTSGVPSEFFDGWHGPNRVSQVLDGGWHLLDPEALNQARIQTGHFVKLLGDEGSKRRLPLVATGWFQDNLFKPAKILRQALAARLLPDEALRLAMGGHVSDSGGVLMAWMNHAKTDSLGNVFDAPGRLAKVEKEITKLHAAAPGFSETTIRDNLDLLRGGKTEELAAALPKSADEVRALGNEYADNLAALAHEGLDSPLHDRQEEIANTIANLTSGDTDLARLHAEKVKLQNQLDSAGPSLINALTGKKGDATILSRFEGKGLDDTIQYKKGQRVILHANDSREAPHMPHALIEEMISQKSDPVFQRIAIGGLFPGDTIEGAAHANGVPSTLDDVERWLTNGDGRTYLDRYAKATGRTFENADDEARFAKQWVSRQADDIYTHWGNNQEARQAIASGKLRGENLADMSAHQWGPRRKPSDTAMAWAREFMAGPDAPAVVRFEPTVSEANKISGAGNATAKAADARRKVVTKLFQAFYGNKSDTFIRIPEYSGSYWSSMEDMIPRLTPEEAAKILPNLDTAELPKAQDARIRTLIGGASGEGDLYHADRLAHGYALDSVNQLLFDMDRKNQFQDMTKLLFPFGRAFWEQVSVWGKLATANPSVLPDIIGKPLHVAEFAHSSAKTIQGAEGGGWFYKDDNGQLVFNYPGTNQLGSMVSALGGPSINTEFRGKVSGLSLAGQLVPSLGPVISIPMHEIIQHVPLPDSVDKLLFPFGPPESLNDAAIPAWFSKVKAGLQGDETNAIYANTLLEVARALGNTGQYGKGQDELDRLMNDAQKQARALTVMRGIGQFVVPAAPVPVYKANVKGQPDMTTTKLAQEFQKFYDKKTGPALIASLGYKNATEAIRGEFGDQALWYVAGKTQSVSGGLPASEAFGNWQDQNGDLVSHYKNVFAYFGPSGDGFSPTVQQHQIEIGLREPRTANDLLAATNAKIADLVYYGQRDAVKADNARVGRKTMSDDQTKWLADLRVKLEEDYPGFNIASHFAESDARFKAQLVQLTAAVKDPHVLSTTTGQRLAEYWKAREGVIEDAAKVGIKGWGQANATAGSRDWLTSLAERLGQDDGGFENLFDDVLSREMKG